MKIKDLEIKNDVFLAPIAGFSDVGFRSICAQLGAGITYTEMASAKGLYYNHAEKTAELLNVTDNEKIKAVQIFGSEPFFITYAVQNEMLSKFDIIDINMGCPMKKIVNNGEGSALMKNPELIEQIVKAAVRGSNGKPVTVKMRAGYVMGYPTAVECAIAAQDGGASMVAIHARYRDQMYAGEADHTITAKVKEALTIPVIANGDIDSISSLEKVARITNADGFMIGRGMLGRPWIFSQMIDEHNEINIKDVIDEHIDLLKELYSEPRIANVMKGQLCYYARNTRHAKAIRMSTSQIKDIESLKAVVDEYLDVNVLF